MKEPDTNAALDVLALGGTGLAEEWHFDWPRQMQQAVHRLRLAQAALPPVAALVGGASSGKSTVFNNLLGGRSVSRITARGHATLGPILAVHDALRPVIEPMLEGNRLFPGLLRRFVAADGNVTGAPDAVDVLFHNVDALRDVMLLDTPDFTSEAAGREGDVTWSLLPWFDRLVVVIDHERWFDRQSISRLQEESTRWAQPRLALFNRTCEGDLAQQDRSALEQQARRLAAESMTILEFRRGRGLVMFAPGTLDDVQIFLTSGRCDRMPTLYRRVADAAERVLGQNDERNARLAELSEAAYAAVDRAMPTSWDCMTALMKPAERRQLEVISRVLRVRQTREWFASQTRRLRSALRHVPLVGLVVAEEQPTPALEAQPDDDRAALAEHYAVSATSRVTNEIDRVVKSSRFWDELRRWTGKEPTSPELVLSQRRRQEIHDAAGAFDEALAAWNQKVDAECRGVGPVLKGALGAGGVTLAIVLIAVEGPLAALTLASAKGAVGAALAKLASAAGAGALLGKHLGRLTEVIHEKLLGSPEWDAVQASAQDFRSAIRSAGTARAQQAIAEADAYVMHDDNPLIDALERLRAMPEDV